MTGRRLPRLPRLEIATALAALVALLALHAAHGANLLPARVAAFGDDLVTTMANRDLNREGREALTAGSTRASSTRGRASAR